MIQPYQIIHQKSKLVTTYTTRFFKKKILFQRFYVCFSPKATIETIILRHPAGSYHYHNEKYLFLWLAFTKNV